MKHFYTLIILVMFIPGLALAEVRLTEIVWMGTSGTNGQYGEWLELYNSGSTAVDVSGWKLYKDAGSKLVFTLSKSIAPGGYLLIERTTASMPDPVPGVDDESGPFGSSGLSNTGENLVLQDASGTTVVTASFASGWPAGNATTKETMQWNGTAWVTAPATPKAATTASNIDADDTPTHEETSPLPVVKKTSKPHAPPAETDPAATLFIPPEVYQYIDYQFKADVVLKNTDHPLLGVFRWNFGDGTALAQDHLLPVMHHFDYPGVYTIWFGYYDSIFAEEPLLEDSKTVSVGLPEVSLSVDDGAVLKITNDSDRVVDLSQWKIVSNNQYAVLPDKTMLAPSAQIMISAKSLGFETITEFSLATPRSNVVISSNQPSEAGHAVEDTTVLSSSPVLKSTTQAIPQSAITYTDQLLTAPVSEISETALVADTGILDTKLGSSDANPK